jgi:hypothetical protein
MFDLPEMQAQGDLVHRTYCRWLLDSKHYAVTVHSFLGADTCRQPRTENASLSRP